MCLEDDAFPPKGEELVEIFNRKFFRNEGTAKLHIVQRDMDEWSMLLNVLAVSIPLCEIIILPV